MKLTKRDREIKRAYNTLLKHNVSVFTLENKEFFEEWIFELWEAHGLKPTAKNMKLVREKAMDYIVAESWEIMQEAIADIAIKQTPQQK